MWTTATLAKDVKASDTVLFAETPYKVKSVWPYCDRVEIVFFGANEEQPYTYELTDPLVTATKELAHA